jgi:putative photosynthetic complex assembly protein 2
MADQTYAALFVLALWWASTGAILWVDGLPKWTFRFSISAVSALALAGLWGLWWSSHIESRWAAYLAFSCALAVWAWHELMFLLGIITGPRKDPCPPGARGWQRFRYATAAIIHHELALALTLLTIAALAWGAPNQVGTWTFLVLWIMRLSAKLNVFLGVRNLAEEFIPEHLRYLLSYFRKARLNPLMPVSLLLAGAVFVHLVGQVAAADATSFVLVGRTLVATILGLALLEHLFLTLPVPDSLLWRWAMRTTNPVPLANPDAMPPGDSP